MDTKQIKNIVLGLTGNEVEVPSLYDTFCNICSRRIHKGDGVLVIQQFIIHANCLMVRMTRMHNLSFRNNHKGRPQTRKTRTTKKAVHTGETAYCAFCGKGISETQTFIKDKKKMYHRDGVNSCWIRYKRVIGNTQNSLALR